MSEERAAKITRLIHEFLGKGNLDVMDEIYDPQLIRHNPPYADTNGLQAYKEFSQGVLNAWSDVQVHIHEVIFSGDSSAIRVTWEATHSGRTPLSNIPPTGKRVTMDGTFIAHWRGDKVVEEWAFLDNLGLIQQLGVIPAQAGAAR